VSIQAFKVSKKIIQIHWYKCQDPYNATVKDYSTIIDTLGLLSISFQKMEIKNGQRKRRKIKHIALIMLKEQSVETSKVKSLST
jgi:hypothetical protein